MDIALTWDVFSGAADFGIDANDLEQDDGLETAVMLSLFTDRRAEDGDILPDGETNRRGWWADAHPTVEGDKFGSRLWLLDRSKQTQAVLDQAEAYALEALQWMIDDKVTDLIEVEPLVPRSGMLGLLITIHRPATDPVKFRFDNVWNSQAGT
jgi:phage gp46-like protein